MPSCLGRPYEPFRVLRSVDLHSWLAGGRASWGRVCRLQMTWREQESSGILRNPPESWGNTGITAHRNSWWKIPVKSEKTGIPATSPKPRSYEKFLRKKQEKKEILRNPVRNVFLDPKNKFLKTGIGNLEWHRCTEQCSYFCQTLPCILLP